MALSGGSAEFRPAGGGRRGWGGGCGDSQRKTSGGEEGVFGNHVALHTQAEVPDDQKKTRFEALVTLDIEHVVLNNYIMELTLTGPIEAFIQRQVAQGYKDADEVARQAFLRWMSEESEMPPHVQTRLDEAAAGRFIPGDRSNIQRIIVAA